MDFSSRWLIICAVLVSSGSVQDVFSIDHQSGGTDWTLQRRGHLTRQSERNNSMLECLPNEFFNGTTCVCRPGFTGEICQYLDSIITVELNRSVEVQMVLNEDYKYAYNDSASAEYKEFVLRFTTAMLAFYRGNNISDVKDVKVTRISREQPAVRMSKNYLEAMKVSEEEFNSRAEGFSFSVTHKVILGLPNTASAEGMYEKDFDSVASAVKLLVGCTEISEACPFNVSGSPTCEKIPVTVGDVCSTPSYLTEHYALVHKANGVLACVTVCDLDHPDSQHCYNEGICHYHWTVGRLCTCPDSDTIWYMYDDCRYPIYALPFYIGLAAGFLFLVVLIAGLIACAVTRNRKQGRTKYRKEKQANQWLDEDLTMRRPNSAAFFTMESGGHGRPASLYQARLSPPSLPPRAHTQTPLPYGGLNRANPLDQNPYQQIRINRPQIVGLRYN